jgi:hypothetical protein
MTTLRDIKEDKMTAVTENTARLYEERSIRGRVPLSEIVTDERYQGVMQPARKIAAMARAWNERAAGVVYLSLRDNDNRYYVLDGKHRVAASRIANGDEAEIEAIVWIGLTLEEEAELFRITNKERRTPSGMEIFKAAVIARNQAAMEIDRIVRSAGLRLESGSTALARDVKAIKAVEFIYAIYGRDMLRNVLTILAETFGQTERPNAIDLSSLKGLALFLARYAAVCDVDRLRGVLVQTGPVVMRRLSLETGTYNNGSASLGSAWGKALRQVYNKGLRSNRLGEWPERDYTSEAFKAGYANRLQSEKSRT